MRISLPHIYLVIFLALAAATVMTSTALANEGCSKDVASSTVEAT